MFRVGNIGVHEHVRYISCLQLVIEILSPQPSTRKSQTLDSVPPLRGARLHVPSRMALRGSHRFRGAHNHCKGLVQAR